MKTIIFIAAMLGMHCFASESVEALKIVSNIPKNKWYCIQHDFAISGTKKVVKHKNCVKWTNYESN